MSLNIVESFPMDGWLYFQCLSYGWVSTLLLSAYFMAECLMAECLFFGRLPMLWLSAYYMAEKDGCVPETKWRTPEDCRFVSPKQVL